MATATRKLDNGHGSQGWLVRNEQGETFGPVDFDTLKSWARDGRLAPTNEVSEDGTAWSLATSCGALEMDWVAEVTPGTFYGPIHRQALDELVRDGSIAATCTRFRRIAAEEPAAATTSDDASREALARASSLETQLQSAERRASAEAERADKQRAAYEERLLSAQQQAAACAADLESARASAQSLDERVARAERRADAEAEQAGKQRAAYEEQLRLAQHQIAACVSELERSHASVAALEARLNQSEGRAAALEEQLRAAQAQASASASELKVALGRAAVLEESLAGAKQALADQAEHEQRQTSAYEEQLRLLQQQVAEHVAQAGRAQARIAALESRVDAAEHLVGERDGELARLREEQASASTKAVEWRAERDAQAAALAAQISAFEAERQEFRAALSHAQAEAAVRSARLAQLENMLEGQSAAAPEPGPLQTQVRALGSEVSCRRQALGGEKEIAQQAKARCASLEAALEEARARCGQLESVGALREEIRLVGRQVEALSGQVAAAQAAAAPARPVHRVEAEPVDVEVLPPDRGSAASARADHKTGPAHAAKAHEPADGASGGHARSPGGLSLADLEKQARRELERLGAQGANLFRKK